MRLPLLLSAALLVLSSVPSVVAESGVSKGWPACVPTSGGLDYPSWLCVDPRDPLCPVYTLTSTDWGVQKRCFGLVEP